MLVRVNPVQREGLVGTALAVLAEASDADGWLRLEVTFQDARHAEWAQERLTNRGTCRVACYATDLNPDTKAVNIDHFASGMKSE